MFDGQTRQGGVDDFHSRASSSISASIPEIETSDNERMSIIVDLDPILEDRIRKHAEGAGLSIEEYVRRLAERDVATGARLSRDEANKIIESFRGKLGPVPSRALDPEFLYGDY